MNTLKSSSFLPIKTTTGQKIFNHFTGSYSRHVLDFVGFSLRLVKMTEIKMTEKRRPKERSVNITFFDIEFDQK